MIPFKIKTIHFYSISTFCEKAEKGDDDDRPNQYANIGYIYEVHLGKA